MTRLRQIVALIITIYGIAGIIFVIPAWRRGSAATARIRTQLHQMGETLETASLATYTTADTLESGSAALTAVSGFAQQASEPLKESGNNLLTVGEEVSKAGRLLEEIAVPATLQWNETVMAGVRVITGATFQYQYPLASVGADLKRAGQSLDSTGQGLLLTAEELEKIPPDLQATSQNLTRTSQEVRKASEDIERSAQGIHDLADSGIFRLGLAAILGYLGTLHLILALIGIAMWLDSRA
jgi:ABC-type transporter Mla subunit MlaD